MAGVVQWQNRSFPSFGHGFDSRRPLPIGKFSMSRTRLASRQAQFFLGCIIFLTGCARSGYHTSLSQPPITPGRREDLADQQSFCWPVIGEVTSFFGSRKEDGAALKGIVIEPRRRADVVACRDGRVAFVDQAFGGYGKTIILEHAGHTTTVYSGNSEILVSLGQWVRQGEVISRAAHAKGSSRRFYFELRKNGKAENPLEFLTPERRLKNV